MLDVKRVLKAAPTKMRSQEPLQQLWTPWGEQIASEWLSSNAAHKAFCPAKDGERKLENGRTPILNEYPRPTMVRSNHTMLNGFWDYAIVSISESDNGSKRRKSATVLTHDEAVQAVKEAAIPETFDGKILVPFSPESALSGVRQTIYPDNMIWYRTIVHPVTLGGEEAVRQIGDANRLILHFEAVDYVCACFIDGQFAGVHVGGYLPFDVDISAFVNPDDAFEIALCVYDPNDSGTQMRGKQKIEREGIWYTAQSGIWQSVWMEIVPEAYMQTLTLKGAADGRLFIRAEIGGDKPNAKLHIVVTDPADGTIVADERLAAGMRKVRTEIATRAEHLWSPEDPYLYDVTATLEFGAAKSQEKQDIVRSYCAFRTVEIKPDLKGVARFHLNGKPLFLKGVLDQGYWPDGLLTAPSDEALIYDITAMKESGFNMLRKHIKIESARWYYHCDRLGMLVWQDAVSGGGEYNAWTTNTSRRSCVPRGTSTATTRRGISRRLVPTIRRTAVTGRTPAMPWCTCLPATRRLLCGCFSTRVGGSSTLVMRRNAFTRLTRRARLTLQAVGTTSVAATSIVCTTTSVRWKSTLIRGRCAGMWPSMRRGTRGVAVPRIMRCCRWRSMAFVRS